MIPSTFDPLYFKTVPPTYSWDQGTPGINYDPLAYITSLSAVKTSTTANEEGIEYVGYAPFVYFSLSSYPGDIRTDFLALERTVDFGDYYNSETNIVTIPGLSSEKFCHIYVMPGVYTITYTRTEHTYYEYLDVDGSGNCLQKYCIDWSYGSLECDIVRREPVTWGSSETGGIYQKKWEFERCEASEYMMRGLYIQPTDKAVKHPLSWQWYNFLCNPLSGNTRNDPINWLSAGFQQDKQFTWKNSAGPCVNLPIEGVTWRWERLIAPALTATVGEKLLTKNITWDEVSLLSPKATTWDFAKNNCSTVGTIVLSANKQTIVKKAIVRVKEIPPTAYLTVEQPQDRLSPLTVRLSPRNTICGSFPIEKIVWDLGDGSPLIEQTRWSNTLEKPFAFSGALGDDYEDPRNYDIIHTYVRSATSPATFYPSITAYAANTYTSDSASVMVGPLKYKNTDGSNFRLLQSELTDQGKVILGQIDDTNVALWRIDTIFKEIITIGQTYYYFGYYSADRPLKNGQSVLYKGIYSNSAKAASLSGKYAFTDELAEGGSFPDLDLWQTNEDGVISWSKFLAHPYNLNTFIDLDIDPELPVIEPYQPSFNLYTDTSVLTSGVSKLYDSDGSSALTVPDAVYDNLDIDRDGRIDYVTTDDAGVITWVPQEYNASFYEGLSGYTRTAYLTSGVSKLYDGIYSDALPVRLEEGYAFLDKNFPENLYSWETDGYGTLSYTMVLAHPYPVGIPVVGYTDVLNLQQGNVVLWNGRGTGATPVTFSNGLTSDIDKDGNVDQYFTDENGFLRWQIKPIHPYLFDFTNGYYVDTFTFQLTSGRSLLWSGQGTGATLVSSTSGVTDISTDSGGKLRTVTWQTNNTGILTFAVVSAHPFKLNIDDIEELGLSYYTDVAVRVSKNTETDTPGTLIWDDYSLSASLVLLVQGTGDIDEDGNKDNFSIDEFGQVTFTMITAHPYKQFNNYWTDQPSLTSGVSVLWSERGTGATLIANARGVADVNNDGNLDSWYTTPTGRIVWTQFAAHPWAQFYGFTDDPILVNGSSVLWETKGSGSSTLSSLSGIWDIDQDGNFDTWKTNENGVLSWVTLTAHPYLQSFGPYYTDSLELTSGKSVLWDGFKSSAKLVENVNGLYDFEGDGDLDAWSINSVGRLSWSLSAVHAYPIVSYYPDAPTYYADSAILIKGVSKLWSKPGSGAVAVSLQNGTSFIDSDVNVDYWTTNEEGIIEWETAVFYDHPFLDTQYFTELSYLQNGVTVVWSNQYSSGTPVANISGEYLDIDKNEGELPPVLDSWKTDENGVLSWNKKIIYPHQFPGLSGFTDTQYITSGVTVLRDTKFIDASPVINQSGLYLNRDNDLSNWQTNQEGVITWALLSAHPYLQSFGYYTDAPELTSGKSVVWNKVGTGATLVTATTGYALIDEDGDLDIWSTNSVGVISWTTFLAHPYKKFYGYSDSFILSSGISKLWNKPTSTAVAIELSSGINFVDEDSDLDEWSVDANGILTFALSVIHPHKLPFGEFYTDQQNVVKNQTYVWSSRGTGAKILSSFVFPNQPRGQMQDLDNDGNVDYYITNPNGTYSWTMFLQYPRAVIDKMYFTDEPQLVSGSSKVYGTQGSGATFITSVSSVFHLTDTDEFILSDEDGNSFFYYSDIQGDGNLGTWGIDANGILSFDLLRIYPYKQLGSYYTLEPELTAGVSEIYNGFGTAATLAKNVTGSHIIDIDTDLDLWTTNDFGIVSWVTLTSHPYSQFVGFTTDPIIIESQTVIYDGKFSSAKRITYGIGVADVDKDGNLDVYNINTDGTALWYKLTAHPFVQFPGYISAADVRTVTNPISVAGNPVIPGTLFTYTSLTSFDTQIGADGVERPLYVADHIPVPYKAPFEQTYVVLTAADVAPVVIDGVTLTEQISVAGHPTIPGTVYTYQMVPRNDGYTDSLIPNTGDILYKDFGSGSPVVSNTQGYTLVGPHSANWSTNNGGVLTINYVSAHPYFQFYGTTDDELKTIVASYYTDTQFIISGVSILWNDYRTAGEIVRNAAGIDDIDRDGTDEEWYTDENGIIHFKLTITIGTYFYSLVSRDWYDTKNWYIYPNRAAGANRLPLSSTNVVILPGTLPAYVNLDDTRWVEPSSIDASNGGIEFFSSTPKAITCPLSGSAGTPVRVTGKATLGNTFGTIHGRYWSSPSETNWYVLSNWYYDEDKIYQANALPLAANEVTILPNSLARPYVDLDNPSWIQPLSINSGIVGITFYSNEKKYVDCDIFGDAKYEGNARYGAEPLIGRFWYSTGDNDWFNVNSWYMDVNRVVKADTGPAFNTDVTIVDGSVRPYVNLDLPNWIQPNSINTGKVGITFFSSDIIDLPAQKVTCSIYGDAYFEGDAENGLPTP